MKHPAISTSITTWAASSAFFRCSLSILPASSNFGLTLAKEVIPSTDALVLSSGPQINNQDRQVDFDSCYIAMDRQDDNPRDKRLTIEEYFEFAKYFGNRTECLDPLAELPIELLIVFNQLSCECAERGDEFTCCENDKAHIPITGILLEEQATSSLEEQLFLRQTCLRTDQAIIAFCGPLPPPIVPPPVIITDQSTDSPTSTSRSTSVPSSSPSASPSSGDPSSSPTAFTEKELPFLVITLTTVTIS